MNRYVVTVEETLVSEYVVWAVDPETAVTDMRAGNHEAVTVKFHVHDEVTDVAIEPQAVA